MQGVEAVVADRELSRELGYAAGSRWVRVDILRLDQDGASKRPVGWTRAYVDAAYGDAAQLLQDSPKALISSLIEKHYGRRVAEVEQTVQATALPASLSKVLDAPADSPALKIIRRYIDQANGAFEITVTIHPADRLVFSMRLRGEHG